MQYEQPQYAQWYPANYLNGQPTELWLVTDSEKFLAAAPLGMYPTDYRIRISNV